MDLTPDSTSILNCMYSYQSIPVGVAPSLWLEVAAPPCGSSESNVLVLSARKFDDIYTIIVHENKIKTALFM